MAGFLEGLGRSNALSSVNNMVGNAINIKKLENADEQTQHENAINMEKLGIMKAKADREQTKFNREELQAKKQVAFLDAPVPISTILGPDYNTHPGKKLQFDYMLKNGMAKEVAPGVFTGTIGNAIEFKKQASADVAFYSTMTEQTIQYTDSQLKKVDAAMSGDKDALKELGNLKPEELQAKKGELSKQLSDQVSASLRIDKKFQEQLALKKAEHEAGKGKLVGYEPGSNKPIVSGEDGIPMVDGKPYTGGPGQPVTAKEKDDDGEWVSKNVTIGGKQVRIRTNTRTGKEEQVSAGPNSTTVTVGGPLKALSPEAGGRLSMLNQGAAHIIEAEKMLFPDGKFSRVTAAGAKLNLPGGTSQKAKMAISNAINAKLRAETGAAATPSEMDNMLSRFQPDPLRDNDESARKKMRDLWSFLDEAAFYLDPEGTYTKKFKEYRKKSSIKDLKSFSDEELLQEINGDGKK